MILTLHILIAVSTMAYSTYLYFDPAPERFKPAYWSLAATIGSGVAMMVVNNASILRTCLSGLFYVGVVSVLITAAKRKLAHSEQDF
jgi:hypothetical protein